MLCSALSLAMLIGPILPLSLNAQDASPVLVRSDMPGASPIVEAGAVLEANRASVWNDGPIRMMLLEGDVKVAVGAYGFRAQSAVIRIDVEEQAGRTIRHVMAYLDEARHMRGRGAVAAQSSRLLVTFSTQGEVDLSTNLMREQYPSTELVADAQQRFGQYITQLQTAWIDAPAQTLLAESDELLRTRARQQHLASIPDDGETPAAPGAPGAPQTPTTTGTRSTTGTRPTRPSVTQKPTPTRPGVSVLPGERTTPADETGAVLPMRGQVTFHADMIDIKSGEDAEAERSVVLVGNVAVVYQAEDEQVMTLTAENAVVFVDGTELSQLAEGSLEPQNIRGIYLEDNVVATNGNYTVRAPRVFYDLTTNRAAVLDAVFYTWDVKHKIPIYVRAQQLRQRSQSSWSAKDALLTTSDFAQPHFAIGAGQVTIEQEQTRSGGVSHRFEVKDGTFLAGGTPIFYWPHFSARDTEIPLRRVKAGADDNGFNVMTDWDAFALAGKQAPEGVDLVARLGYLGEHGAAIGAGLRYELPGMFGGFDTMLLPSDSGVDDIGDRDDVEFDSDARGHALWRHRHFMADDWQLSLELSFVSDPTYLEEFRSDEVIGKDYETALYLKKQVDDWAFTFLSSYNLNDFTAQTTTLQTPGYTVEKLPEVGYYRVGTSLWNDRLTYYTENRLGRMRVSGGDDDPDDRGFTAAQSMLLFGMAPTTSYEDALESAGVPMDWVLRFDSRHEIQAPMKWGPIDAVPYLVGRFTAYDDDFEDFSGEDDQSRLWGAAGIRMHTQLSRTYEEVDWPLLDVHRLRHLIEPSLEMNLSASTVDHGDLPIYDAQVEGIQEGFTTRFGLKQTFQTQRGGPGRWRSVDWLVLNMEWVDRSNDSDVDQRLPRYFAYRPEYSLGGDHFHSNLAWMITDSLAMAGDVTYNSEYGRVDQWRVGVVMQQTPRLTWYADYTDVDPFDDQLLSYGFTYALTRKWSMGFDHVVALEHKAKNYMELRMERKLPQFRLLFVASHDQLDDEQIFGIVLVPEGFGSAPSLGRLAR